MDATILIFTILMSTLAAIIIEEVRDLRYIPLLVIFGLAITGGLLCITDMGLTIEPISTITKSVLEIFGILAGFVFFRDMRIIKTTCKDADSCYRKSVDLLKTSSYLLRSSKGIREEAQKKETTAAKTIESTRDSIEGLQHG